MKLCCANEMERERGKREIALCVCVSLSLSLSLSGGPVNVTRFGCQYRRRRKSKARSHTRACRAGGRPPALAGRPPKSYHAAQPSLPSFHPSFFPSLFPSSVDNRAGWRMQNSLANNFSAPTSAVVALRVAPALAHDSSSASHL